MCQIAPRAAFLSGTNSFGSAGPGETPTTSWTIGDLARIDLLHWSQSVDRHLKELAVDGNLRKLRTSLYYCPRKFGLERLRDEHELIKVFLKTNRFVVTSPNAYNQLEFVTTQLYNNRVVYNQKRHGTFRFGNRLVTFERRFDIPKQLTPESLLVDLVNELDRSRRVFASEPTLVATKSFSKVGTACFTLALLSRMDSQSLWRSPHEALQQPTSFFNEFLTRYILVLQ